MEKLLKRAKLLKLKMKKAKNDESKKRFQKMARDVERQVGRCLARSSTDQRVSSSVWCSADRHHVAVSAQGQDWSAPSPRTVATADGRTRRLLCRQQRQQRMGSERRAEAHGSSRCASRGACRAATGQAQVFRMPRHGHSAKDCPNALDAQSIALKSDRADAPMVGRDAVGICFRCGSTEHTLSKCRKPALKHDELPYATCFICHAKGHLSSKCPNNAGRGVYPEGGSCKLCSSVEHLAKDCPLSLRNEGKRNTDKGAKSLVHQVIVGSTKESNANGGDEDDFHSFARKRVQVEQESKSADPPAKKHKSSAKVVSF